MEFDKCAFCGGPAPEGLRVCPECLKANGAGEAEVEAAQDLRDIAAILGITAETDKNIKDAMNGILNIAGRLEREKKKDG